MGKDNSANSKAFWTYDATIMLINKYRAYKKTFADSIHKNTEVWEMIATEFKSDGFTFNGSQCENRWKYIRSRYVKKKDNSGAGSTGEECFKFEYFDELDAILGKQVNIVPKFVASSEPSSSSQPQSKRSRASNNDSTTFNDSGSAQFFFNDGGNDDPLSEDFSTDSRTDTNDNKSTSKGKMRKEPWEENVERQDRYHNEMMQIQRESLRSFNDFMTKFLDKL